MFYPCEGYRSVTPPDAARVNRTIFHYHSVSAICYYYIVARPNILYIQGLRTGGGQRPPPVLR